MKRRPQKRTLQMLLLLLTAAIFALSVPAFFVVKKLTRDKSFSSERWQNPTVYRTNGRLDMADDLIARHLLTGKTKLEVLAMLGPEETERPFRDEHLVYYLGPELGFFSIDSEWLAIRFDSTDVVMSYRLLRD